MISIIVPVYNMEKYLNECVDSILNQSYTDLEIILVNDGSTDSSTTICDKYKEKDSRIVVIHKENGGLSDARNAGLDIAKGDYIGFVDSDDIIHPQMYEFLLAAILETDADMVRCNHTVFQDDTPIAMDTFQASYTLEAEGTREDFLNNFLRADFTHYVWKCLYKRSLLDSLRFQKGKHMEDVMFMGELSSCLSKYAQTEEALYYYRLRNDSIAHAKPQIYLEHIDAMLYNLNHFKNAELPAYTKQYAEFVMNHILLRRLQMRVYGTADADVNKQAFRVFRRLYRQYGSTRNAHRLAMYLPWLYDLLRYPKLKRSLKESPEIGFYRKKLTLKKRR